MRNGVNCQALQTARFAGARKSALAICLMLVSVVSAYGQSAKCEEKGHTREFWREIAKNHYMAPTGQHLFPLARELGSYFCSADPELRDDLAYSILSSWILRQKKFSHEELLALAKDWQANLRIGIGETGTDSIFTRSFSALTLASIAERDLKDPFLDNDGYRTLLDNALKYLNDEQDLRGFDARKGWIHATAHTSDLLAALAQNQFFTKKDAGTVLEAILRRLATANVVFQYGEQDRLANAAALIISRPDFDSEQWKSLVAKMDQADRSFWNESPPKLVELTRFENDSYFLQALVAQGALRTATPASAEAQKIILVIRRGRQ